jgi:tyrosinase
MMETVNDEVPADQQPAWKLAASRWRLPYWDWATPQPYIKNYGIPEICTLEKINIAVPTSNGVKVPMDNPLWKFSNPKGIPMGDPSMGKFKIPGDPGPPAIPVY